MSNKTNHKVSLYESIFGSDEIKEATYHVTPDGLNGVSESVMDELDSLKIAYPKFANFFEKLKSEDAIAETDDLTAGFEMFVYNLGRKGITRPNDKLEELAKIMRVDVAKALKKGYEDMINQTI